MKREVISANMPTFLAWLEGKTIEVQAKGDLQWSAIEPAWDSPDITYRVKPEPHWSDNCDKEVIWVAVSDEPIASIEGLIVTRLIDYRAGSNYPYRTKEAVFRYAVPIVLKEL